VHYTGTTPDSSTFYYFGGAYEVTGTNVRKYYSFEGQMVAVRACPSGTCSGPNYLLTDHLGSVVAVTDSAGVLLTQQRYLPFGEERDLAGYSMSGLTDYTYTGQRSLDEGMGGLMDYKARMYSPYINHFTQPDTILSGFSQGLNRYSYVVNNPINANDPSGHKCIGNPEECMDFRTGKPIRGANTRIPLKVPHCTSSICNPNAGKGERGTWDVLYEREVDGEEYRDINDDSFLSEVSYLTDVAGVVVADINMIVVDTMAAIVIASGCATVAGCLPAIEYAIAIDFGMSLLSPFAIAGNLFDAIGFGLTFIEDIRNGSTNYKLDSRGMTIGIGGDTTESFKNLGYGIVPEANFAAYISNEQLKYSDRRRSGELPTITHEIFVPMIDLPYIWGEDCNFFC
jgi:RHS repeat-associated protein